MKEPSRSRRWLANDLKRKINRFVLAKSAYDLAVIAVVKADAALRKAK